MKTYEFTIHRTVRVRMAMAEEARLSLLSETDEARELLVNYAENAGRPRAPALLDERIYAGHFREVKS